MNMKTFRCGCVAALVAWSVLGVEAATLSQVPMQGGMVMPMVAYRADEARFRVMMPMEVPVLTPLLVSHPGDSFAPGDPWFDALDPSRQGLSFSRRYGFVMDVMSDPLPEGTQMWIRKLSGPAELGVYRYGASEPKALEPIFGTAGSSMAWRWNGMMFHPVFTAPSGTNEFEAMFEVYLVTTAGGTEVPGSGSGALTLRFENLPDGRPQLGIHPAIVVDWPADTGEGWVLEMAGEWPSTNWSVVTDTPVMLNGRPSVVLEAGSGNRFYRMRRQP